MIGGNDLSSQFLPGCGVGNGGGGQNFPGFDGLVSAGGDGSMSPIK